MSPVDSLWKSADVADATGGTVNSAWEATGVSIDSRTIMSGDLFVALRGPTFDGHDYVTDALGRGASALLISCKPKGLRNHVPVLEVLDTFAGLKQLGIAGRARSKARVIAVTGSVGKTSVKETIARLLGRQGSVSYSLGGLNNHYGVPLSLSRLPKESEFGVFELGMNNAGELTDLSRMVRPLVAVVTTVEIAHLENFESLEDIARAKAEIFKGLQSGGVAILNRDNLGFGILKKTAESLGVNIVTFGSHKESNFNLASYTLGSECSNVQIKFYDTELNYKLNIPGYHWIQNSLAALSAVHSVGADIFEAARSVASIRPLKGRGLRHRVQSSNFEFELIDDSYNASPASMAAALEVLSGIKISSTGRRIAVLGDMLELGKESRSLHLKLAAKVMNNKVDLVYATGLRMRDMYEALPATKQAYWAETSENLLSVVSSHLQQDDVVLVKGSLGARMGLVVDGLLALGEEG